MLLTRDQSTPFTCSKARFYLHALLQALHELDAVRRQLQHESATKVQVNAAIARVELELRRDAQVCRQ
jgi:hypothetical protein